MASLDTVGFPAGQVSAGLVATPAYRDSPASVVIQVHPEPQVTAA